MPRTSAMWEAAEASVRASAKHPFLLAMLDGTLGLRAPRTQVSQSVS